MTAIEVSSEQPVGRNIADRLRESEERYRALFNAIDQGFCIVEMLFDDRGQPADYRFLEVNAAFEAQTGLADAVGRTMRSLRPDHEAHWFDIYGRVALTGEPVRFERPAAALERWYEVYAFRVGAAERRRVGILFNDITGRKHDEERMALLTTEIDHRAKNMLTVVAGLVHLTRADTVAEFKASLLGRIAALANSQRLLSESRGQGADLARLVADELAAFHAAGHERATWSGPAVTLPMAVTQSMAMVLHELAANATKYGALSVDKGRVSIDWSRREDGALRLRWSESGGPPVEAPSRRGTGTGIIMASIRSQLGGEVAFTWRPEGLLCEMLVPANAVKT